MGCILLVWVVVKGDVQIVVMLFSFGVDFNIMDVQIFGLLFNVVVQGYIVCVEFFFEVGVDLDFFFLKGVQKGSLFSVVLWNSKDVILLKRLLDFGVDVNICMVEGKMLLFYVIRNDNVSFVMLFLEYGVDLNVMVIIGEIFFMMVIIYNSYNVLCFFFD